MGVIPSETLVQTISFWVIMTMIYTGLGWIIYKRATRKTNPHEFTATTGFSTVPGFWSNVYNNAELKPYYDASGCWPEVHIQFGSVDIGDDDTGRPRLDEVTFYKSVVSKPKIVIRSSAPSAESSESAVAMWKSEISVIVADVAVANSKLRLALNGGIIDTFRIIGDAQCNLKAYDWVGRLIEFTNATRDSKSAKTGKDVIVSVQSQGERWRRIAPHDFCQSEFELMEDPNASGRHWATSLRLLESAYLGRFWRHFLIGITLALSITIIVATAVLRFSMIHL